MNEQDITNLEQVNINPQEFYLQPPAYENYGADFLPVPAGGPLDLSPVNQLSPFVPPYNAPQIASPTTNFGYPPPHQTFVLISPGFHGYAGQSIYSCIGPNSEVYYSNGYIGQPTMISMNPATPQHYAPVARAAVMEPPQYGTVNGSNTDRFNPDGPQSDAQFRGMAQRVPMRNASSTMYVVGADGASVTYAVPVIPTATVQASTAPLIRKRFLIASFGIFL